MDNLNLKKDAEKKGNEKEKKNNKDFSSMGVGAAVGGMAGVGGTMAYNALAEDHDIEEFDHDNLGAAISGHRVNSASHPHPQGLHDSEETSEMTDNTDSETDSEIPGIAEIQPIEETELIGEVIDEPQPILEPSGNWHTSVHEALQTVELDPDPSAVAGELIAELHQNDPVEVNIDPLHENLALDDNILHDNSAGQDIHTPDMLDGIMNA